MAPHRPQFTTAGLAFGEIVKLMTGILAFHSTVGVVRGFEGTRSTLI